MKQVQKTQQVIDRMRAAFGADVDASRLPVYEATLLNTSPLRKSGGIFKGARVTPATLTQIANSINQESAPIRLEHWDTEAAPHGRVFYAEVQGDELRGLFTVDDPELQPKVDNGTIDQVSVGFMPAAINCSACGFDFMSSSEALWNLTCGEGHVLNESGVFAYVEGLTSFNELSLVGKGAAQGARIVGPSESRLANANDNYRRLAAKAGFSGIALTCEEVPTPKKEDDVDLTALTAQLTSATEAKTKAEVKLEAAEATVVTLTAERDDLKTQLAAANSATAEQLAAAQAEVKEAVAVLAEDLTAVLTALQKPVENLPTDIAGLKAALAEHRAAFAAVIPVDGKSKGVSETAPTIPANSAAFSTRR